MGAAVAAVLVKERHVADAFQRAGATSPERAVVPDDIAVDLGGVGGRRLLRHAVLREASAGRYYLDEPTWVAVRSTRRRLVFVLLVVVGLVALYFMSVALTHSASPAQ
ncbi:MAG: hypothetical protein JF589_07850 [Gemmatimonadetes bacterium]|jgi:hypothetical protein|nr:hypothetical protein [Gemmatimonadota bacterium]